MVVYKLKYYNIMGMAEPIRYLLAYGNMNYENLVYDLNVEWPKVASSMPLHKVPVLEVDTKYLWEPLAISEWLGTQHDLVVDDLWLTAEIHSVAQSMMELWQKVWAWHNESNVQKKQLLRHELDSEIIPVYMTALEAIVANNGTYFAGKLTWVDLWFVGIMESVQGMLGLTVLQSKYPNLAKVYNMVRSVPAIKDYITKRPVYKY